MGDAWKNHVGIVNASDGDGRLGLGKSLFIKPGRIDRVKQYHDKLK